MAILSPFGPSPMLAKRGIGVGVKGVAGRVAIVDKRLRNSSHKAAQ